MKRGQVVKTGRSMSWRSVVSSSSTSRVQSSLEPIRQSERGLPVRIERQNPLLREVDKRLVRSEQTAADALLVRDVLQNLYPSIVETGET